MTKNNTSENNSLKQSKDSKAGLIYPPNCLQIPNALCDYWMSKLTPAEFKVLVCIYRKSFTWFKLRDTISLTKIEEMTGLSRRGIVSNLKSLVNYGLIIKTNIDTEHETINYEICLFPSDNRK